MIEIQPGDCLSKLPEIKSSSIGLVLIDPPYFKVKDHEWDNQWETEASYLDFMDTIISQSYRVLEDESTFITFCSSEMQYQIETICRKYFTVLNTITWHKVAEKGHDGWKGKCSKPSLRKWYPSTERVIVCQKSTYGQRLKFAREAKGMSAKELAAMLGAHGKVNNGGSVSNWETGKTPPPDKYLPILETFLGVSFVPRKFNVTEAAYLDDVWFYPPVKAYKGKHPCEKPLNMIEDIIKATTYEGAIVLDFFLGSGTTGVACKNTGRNFIGIEKDPAYFAQAQQRINGKSNL